jgi:hypothetical protein
VFGLYSADLGPADTGVSTAADEPEEPAVTEFCRSFLMVDACPGRWN